ncbi:hypothetical protein N7468_010649 [Penicillium chermesinum]|uniref:Asl1-like glycosyl hydrolase catalytic domain-containing protein n=1 Tax=Penicillium chermesinum TaxID=63820 RepID=A0A9W9TAZ4_9EURO|nr:uncharacterized protein N7468_010649 [Penicillium chermesinum]KAJ5214970.1 hypothetical protein N7468_010649 [Penicillium chermesinum]KAJ6141525.1 hypothetical protein N7470_009915 [Penicillium chermesinum]
MVSFTKAFTAGLMASAAMALPINSPVQKRSTAKRGAAYNDISTVFPLASSGTVSWAYNWAGSLNGDLPSGVEYVPMLWGAKFFTGWVSAIETALSSGSSYIMGFNEPDNTAQANMSPGEAAGYYQQYITQNKGDAKLISPAVTSSTTPGQGLDWFEQFIGQCSSCDITGLAVHWYGPSADEFKTFIESAIDTATRHGLSEVWVTEFALDADINGVTNQANAINFLNEAIPYLDSQDMVTHYSYFMSAENFLLSNGALNPVGEAYVSTSD